MSSTYLTSSDMQLIECLLTEVRSSGPERDFDWTAEARLLIHAVEEGTRDASDLRQLLAQHRKLHRIFDNGLMRWEGEGGSVSHAAQTHANATAEPLLRSKRRRLRALRPLRSM